MTQENKELLLKDLCARLPYGVKILGPWKKDGPCELSAIDLTSRQQIRVFEDWFSVEEVKPYLCPMSSMTEEEYEAIRDCFVYCEDEFIAAGKAVDYFNSHHFDYRGLIEKGLAIEAPEGIYNIR